MTTTRESPWLRSRGFDLGWILAPPFVATGLAVALHRSGLDGEISPFAWLLLVVGVDVAHVYATLFRTYLDRDEQRRRAVLLRLVPLGMWAAGAVAYGIGAWLFWRLLAYLAVFHFVRQQYGFMRLYGQFENDTPTWARNLDGAAIYAATLYPLVYWHTHLPRAFDWFVNGDFIHLPPSIESTARGLYIATLLAYAAKELWLLRARARINVPKNLVLTGTALAWWAGIVHFNGDLTFTLSNVVAHGVPYLGLVWLSVSASGEHSRQARVVWGQSFFASAAGVPAYWLVLAILAYVEEGLWDGFIWRDHAQIFPGFQHLPTIAQPTLLALLVPLLALPQSVHYVLDGFIWKLRERSSAADNRYALSESPRST